MQKRIMEKTGAEVSLLGLWLHEVPRKRRKAGYG